MKNNSKEEAYTYQKIHADIQKIIFNTSDPEFISVTVQIKHDDTSDYPMKRTYKKTFPKSISIIDLLKKHMFQGEDHYLLW